jgi:TonB family protein
MKQTAAIMGMIAGLALAGCATSPGGDPLETERVNQIMRAPARTENETPAQRDLREAREQAFGEKIGLLSTQDAYEPPRLIRNIAPIYPPAAGKAGHVNVGVIIDPTGRIKDARVISSTDPVFEAAALAAVKQWRFTPGRKDGQPISMSFIFPVDFVAK